MDVIRRYTPPTCTLEIKAKQSPLSKWSNRPLYKDIRFELRFDDPRIIEGEQIEITGDNHQLELLCDVVTEYVQNFLNPTSNYDYELPLTTTNKETELELITETNFNQTENQLEKQLELITENNPNQTENQEIEIKNIKITSNVIHLPSKPYLKSQNLISHELFFGSLVPEKTYLSVKLTALQLFDLATALDNYQNDLKVLPDFSSQTKTSRRGVYSLWRNVAGIILTVGLTTVGLRAYDNYNTQVDQVAITEQNSQTLPPNQPELVAPLPPPPPPNTNLPQFKPLESGQQLTPPNGVTIDNSKTANNPTVRSSSNAPNLPPPPAEIKPNLPPPPPSNLPEINIPLTAPAGDPNLPKSLPSLPNQPSSLPTFEDQPNENTLEIQPSSLPTIASNPPLNNRNSGEIEANQNREIVRNTTLTDTLNEVKRYFQKEWMPPEQLTQMIQYRLLINQNGTIAQITPIGSLSGVYIDRTNLPLMGEKFVNSFNYAHQITIRLALFPDGKVDVFQE